MLRVRVSIHFPFTLLTWPTSARSQRQVRSFFIHLRTKWPKGGVALFSGSSWSTASTTRFHSFHLRRLQGTEWSTADWNYIHGSSHTTRASSVSSSTSVDHVDSDILIKLLFIHSEWTFVVSIFLRGTTMMLTVTLHGPANISLWSMCQTAQLIIVFSITLYAVSAAETRSFTWWCFLIQICFVLDGSQLPNNHRNSANLQMFNILL